MPLIPRGPENLHCPFWHKPMSECCHICPLWTQLRGVDPQTGEPIPDEWNCAIGHMPKLLVENSQMSRQTGAAVESLRNRVKEFTNIFRTALGHPAETRLIDDQEKRA